MRMEYSSNLGIHDSIIEYLNTEYSIIEYSRIKGSIIGIADRERRIGLIEHMEESLPNYSIIEDSIINDTSIIGSIIEKPIMKEMRIQDLLNNLRKTDGKLAYKVADDNTMHDTDRTELKTRSHVNFTFKCTRIEHS